MKNSFTVIIFILFLASVSAQNQIQLSAPDTSRGYPVMKALLLRASASEYDTAKLTMRDLSDLLWAANGINRPESGKRTAPSAINAQDIDIYVFMKEGVYFYDPREHQLNLIVSGDHRNLTAGRQQNVAMAPVICLLVSDISKFQRGEDSQKLIWAAEDAGIVSQNISVFCASVGLVTRPRASMDTEKIKDLLKLKTTQHLMLNNPVAYKKR